MILELPIRHDSKQHMIVVTLVGGGGGAVGVMVVVTVVMELFTVCIKSILHYVQS